MPVRIFFLMMFMLYLAQVHAQELRIIPQPLHIHQGKGNFVFRKHIRCRITGNLNNEWRFIQQELKKRWGIDITLVKSGRPELQLTVSNNKMQMDSLGREGYRLVVDEHGMRINAPYATGVFYGIQSLFQLIEHTGSDSRSYLVTHVQVADKPRFAWRSFLLDEARTFKGMKVVKELLDEMAALKMNRFHWHLTDDQGWRIEIKKYPLLTGIGSKRIGTQIRYTTQLDSLPHEGFYTRQEIREIIQYASKRHISIVPEIEMPGHASAAIASYPWLGTSGKQIEVPGMFGVFKDVFNIADTRVQQFLEEVLEEVMTLFPSGIVHIGGDEVKYDQWKSSSKVQAFLNARNLRTPADLQIWFINRISAFVDSRGRRLMGWNDILGDRLHEYNDPEDTQPTTQLSPSAIIHFWKGDPALINKAISRGHDVVNSYHEYTYLDYDYQQIPLEKAYGFEPVPAEVSAAGNQDKIIGIGCQMWGEWIGDKSAMDRQVYPRIAAYAECGWSAPLQKNFEGFKKALLPVIREWRKKNIRVGLELF